MTDPQHEETFADTERKLREIITTLRVQLAEAQAAKWKEKHVDTMDDKVLMGMAMEEAADRIEQLVATNEALSIANATLIAERDQWIAHAKNAIWSDSEQLRLAEAELAALVDAAEKVINSYWHSTDGVITGIYDLEASLAEIKSHSDEFATQKGETHE